MKRWIDAAERRPLAACAAVLCCTAFVTITAATQNRSWVAIHALVTGALLLGWLFRIIQETRASQNATPPQPQPTVVPCEPPRHNQQRRCIRGHRFVTCAPGPGQCWCGERQSLAVVRGAAGDVLINDGAVPPIPWEP